MRRSAVLALAALVVLSCSGETRRGGPTPTTSAGTGATTSAATTSTTMPCSSAAPPASTVRQSQVTADIDGNGTADRTTVFGIGTAAAPGPWFVSVQLGPTDRREAAIVDADANDPAQRIRVLGAARVGSATPAVFVAVGTGAAATIVGLFQLVGCDLVRVVTSAGAPATFTIGGTVTHLDGLRCDGSAGFTALSARSADGTTYAGSTTKAVVVDGRVTTSPPETVAAIDPSALDGYGHLDCPGVEPI